MQNASVSSQCSSSCSSYNNTNGSNSSSSSISNPPPSSAPPPVPLLCCSCNSDIAVTKAVLLQCECKHAFCLDCARKQLFDTMRQEAIGIGEVSVICPSCKQRPVVSKEGKSTNLVTLSVLAAQSAEQDLVCYVLLCAVAVVGYCCARPYLISYHLLLHHLHHQYHVLDPTSHGLLATNSATIPTRNHQCHHVCRHAGSIPETRVAHRHR